MGRYLGLDVPDDARGCLQDVHWSHGAIGYFPTYTLGNLYAAQMLEQIARDVPNLWDQVRARDFRPLLGWLRANVHSVGRRKTAIELVRDATKRAPGSKAYLDYLERKYGEIYSL
jgi:carboxypeptidase Taq